MPPLVYKPLSQETSEIRILWLLPGSGTSPIEVRLEHVPFESAGQLQYEAISYAWGPPEDPGTINMKTTSSDIISTLSIRRNLYEGLQQLRLEDGERALWADAICINQHDLEERGQQVERMAEIYKTAKQVVVWLGRADDAAGIAIRLFNKIASNVEFESQSDRIVCRSPAEEDHWANLELPLPFDHTEWAAMRSFTSRPWFSRLWVWQEIVQEEVVFMCGRYQLSKAIMELVATTVSRKLKEPLKVDVINQCADITKILMTSALLTLQSYIDMTEEAQCSDPRDRIYALRGLVSPSECIRDLAPDYTKSSIALYRDVVLKYLSAAGELNLLSECSTRRHLSFSDTSSIPTWIPDFSRPALTRLIFGARSCWMSTAHAAVLSYGERLRTKGIVFAAVASTEPTTIDTENEWTVATALAIQRLCTPRIQETYMNGQTMSEVLCRILTANFMTDVWATHPNPEAPDIVEAEEYLHLLCDRPQSVGHALSSQQSSFLKDVYIALRNRTFFTTTDGYIGVAPESTRAGDEICIILGCQTPLVLRSDGRGNREIFGKCYVHGIMEGESLLGPLPNGWRRANKYSRQHGADWPVFVHNETGQLMTEDPRLGDLPPGWKRESWDRDHYVRYVREDGVKPEFPDKDPRMTCEALEARGVKFEDIVIS
ncbi:MAG: hypothetical protein OHK93_001579 [Ramalina farinacea]|uniref:Heterokaryon incompatibility domain-containing protein n=1 Tax=Ramalina farinacea TaxID=258253 RepID=A0AA43QPV2_9LECA|nr:hypothetical protein [Ramalina farinacea]